MKGGGIDKGYACSSLGPKRCQLKRNACDHLHCFFMVLIVGQNGQYPYTTTYTYTYKEGKLEKEMKEGDSLCGWEYAIPMDMKRRGLPTRATVVTLGALILIWTLLYFFIIFLSSFRGRSIRSHVFFWAKRLSHEMSFSIVLREFDSIEYTTEIATIHFSWTNFRQQWRLTIG